MTCEHKSLSNKSSTENNFRIVERSMFNQPRVILNIGGSKYDVRWKTLESLPNSRLGKIRFAKSIQEILYLCDEVDFEINEIYFDRPARSFTAIIDFYRTNKLHSIQDICVVSFLDDLIYWGIDDNFFEPCCNFSYHQLKDEAFDEIEKIDRFERAEDETGEEIFTNCCPDSRRVVWNIMENPETSLLAKIVTTVSIFFVILSTFTLVLTTLPFLKIATNITASNSLQISGNVPPNIIVEYKDRAIFEYIEIVCILWFTLEYILRVWSAPDQLVALKSPLNIIDLISILPFYFSLMMNIFSPNSNISESSSTRKIFTLFRVLRVLRIFKLARQSKGLKSFGKTIQKSSDEFILLFFFLSIEILLFSSLAYFAEKDEDGTQFTSIPAAFWWAVISITTVGYGDMVPVTSMGKLISALCCVSGILLIATPIPIIVSNFNDICTNENKRDRVLKYKEERLDRIKQMKEKELELFIHH